MIKKERGIEDGVIKKRDPTGNTECKKDGGRGRKKDIGFVWILISVNIGQAMLHFALLLFYES